MSLIDPVAAINKIHREGRHPVPYPAFMNCFNRLIKDLHTLEPKPPSEDLKEFFRAVCMGMDLGIADPGHRGEDRRREFYERIYPVWKASLAEEEFQRYQDILEGKSRREQERQREQERDREAREREERQRKFEEHTLEQARPMIAGLARDALDALAEAREEERPPAAPPGGPAGRLAEAKHLQGPRQGTSPAAGDLALEEPAIVKQPTPAAGSPDGDLGRSSASARSPAGEPATEVEPQIILAEGGEQPFIAKGIVGLVAAVEGGRLPLRYATRATRQPLARLTFRDGHVAVQLVAAGGGYYMLMTLSKGPAGVEHMAVTTRNVLATMGYLEKEALSFEKIEGEAKIKVRVTARAISVAVKRPRPYTGKTLARELTETFGQIVAMLEAIEASGVP
jgi:hypothetical protein